MTNKLINDNIFADLTAVLSDLKMLKEKYPNITQLERLHVQFKDMESALEIINQQDEIGNKTINTILERIVPSIEHHIKTGNFLKTQPVNSLMALALDNPNKLAHLIKNIYFPLSIIPNHIFVILYRNYYVENPLSKLEASKRDEDIKFITFARNVSSGWEKGEPNERDKYCLSKLGILNKDKAKQFVDIRELRNEIKEGLAHGQPKVCKRQKDNINTITIIFATENNPLLLDINRIYSDINLISSLTQNLIDLLKA